MQDYTVIDWVIRSIIIALGFGFISSMFVVTQQKTSKIITMFGKFVKSTNAGLSTKLPWPLATVKDWMDLSILELKGEVTVKSADNAFLTIPWSLQYRVMPDKIKEAYYELDNPEEQIKSYILNTLRGKSSEMPMNDLFKSNEALEASTKESLDEKFGVYGYEIVSMLVDDPQPSKTLKTVFDEVIASERKKDAAQNLADAVKIQMVGEATAEGDSLKIKGKAFKEFRKDISEGNSEAVKEFLKDMPDDSLRAKDVLDFFAGVDLREAIRDASSNEGNIIVIPANFDGNISLPVPAAKTK